MGYQHTGAAFLHKLKKALLLDEQGLGKSAQAIRACDLAGIARVIVICPAVVKENWVNEFKKFGRIPRKADVFYGKKHKVDPTADLLVVNFELTPDKGVLSALRKFGASAVIIDEAHYLKNREAKRTIAVYGKGCTGIGGVIEAVPCVWPLTGTPIPNHPGELWSTLRAVAPDALRVSPGGPIMGYAHFQARFCNVVQTPFGEKITGGKNLAELRTRLSSVAIRRLKKDVLTQLPPFRVVLTPLSSASAVQKLNAHAANTPGMADLVNALSGTGANDDDVAQALAHASPHMTTIRKLTGQLKAPLVADLVANDLDAGMPKIVVFAVHRDVVDYLEKALSKYNPVSIHGGTPAGSRQAVVDRFQNDPSCRVFIGNIQAAGTGITLTAASDLLFAELSWVPADNAQAAMRVHRIGQLNPVLVRMVTLPGTVDEIVAGAIRRKTKTIAEVLN